MDNVGDSRSLDSERLIDDVDGLSLSALSRLNLHRPDDGMIRTCRSDGSDAEIGTMARRYFCFSIFDITVRSRDRPLGESVCWPSRRDTNVIGRRTLASQPQTPRSYVDGYYYPPGREVWGE